MGKRVTLNIFLGIFLFLGIFISFASAQTLIVDDNNASLNANFSTIQAAVNFASSGDVIDVAAGTYDEQVVINNKSLTIQGAGNTTVIKPSSDTVLTTFYTTGTQTGAFFNGIIIAGIIDVRNGGDTEKVTIKNLKVDGESITALPSGAGHVSGIVFGETSGVIDDVTVEDTNAVLPATVRTYSIWADAVGGTNVSVNVTDSTTQFYGRNGINARGNNINVNFEDNIITGPGNVSSQVPNGVLIISGARGKVVNNNISSGHYSLFPEFAGSGILLFDAGNSVLVSDNEVFDVDDAVLIAGTNFTKVENNNLHKT